MVSVFSSVEETSVSGKNKPLLKRVEILGNKLPDPFVLFTFLAILIIILSAVGAALGGSVLHPSTGETVSIKSLASAEGIQFILTSMIDNFTGFAPLGLVLTIMLGIGLAEQVGYLGHGIQSVIKAVPAWMLPYAAIFLGINGNLASDAAMVIIPPLTAMVFLQAGRHPVAGIAAGFAGSGIGFTANLVVTGTDALLGGITTEAAKIVSSEATVTPVANWYFNIVAVVVLTVVGGLVTTQVIEPVLGEYQGEYREKVEAPTRRQTRAFVSATLVGAIYVSGIFLALLPSNSPLRGPNGELVKSPFLQSIIPLMLILFLLVGGVYGVVAGKIQSSRDFTDLMAKGISGMTGYIVLVFAISQFIEYFNWSNLGLWLAVNGANVLENIGFTGLALIICYSIFTALLNFLIPSGSAKWALEAPVFVPLFMQLGYSPGYVQAAYRIGDSSTNMVTPLSPYMPIVLGYIRKYDEKAGFGTYFSLMIPYTIAFFVAFLALFIVFSLLGIPFGPGVVMRMEG